MNNDWLELEGKTVIVTGAASGIGKAVAQEFLNIGANVVISDMAENAPEMDAKEGQLLYVRTDVTKVSDVEAMVAKTIETFGTIDVLVKNIIGACIKCGSEIELVCEGPDEEAALAHATELIESGLGE